MLESPITHLFLIVERLWRQEDGLLLWYPYSQVGSGWVLLGIILYGWGCRRIAGLVVSRVSCNSEL